MPTNQKSQNKKSTAKVSPHKQLPRAPKKLPRSKKKTLKRSTPRKKLNRNIIIIAISAIIVIALFILLAIPVTEPGEFRNEFVWSNKTNAYFNGVIILDDGTFVALATAKEPKDSDSNDYFEYLVKFNQKGELIWQKELENQNPQTIIKDKKGDGFLVAGAKNVTKKYYSRSDFPAVDAMLTKYDNNGNVVWENLHSAVTEVTNKTSILALILSSFGDVIQTKSGDYVTIGSCAMKSGSNYKIDDCLVKIDASGNLLWEKEYSPGLGYLFTTEALTADGNIVASNLSKMVYFSGSGERLWNKDFDIKSNIITRKNTIIFKEDKSLVALNEDGNEIWRHDYGMEKLAEIIPLPSGDIIIANDSKIIKANSDGEKQWEKHLNGEDTVGGGFALDDGRFVLWGTRDSKKAVVKFSDFRRNVFGLMSWIQ